ncbi:MAG: ZIP family metal transporter [Candidatus Hodarchaeales archaeon]|jgi:zinc and cadmium transporter
MLLIWIIIFSSLGSIGAVITATAFLLIREPIQNRLIPSLISFASGTLLTAALLGLIPHALEHLDSETALLTVLVGIFLFFLLEKTIVWRHCHDMECEAHRTVGPMIIIGDAFHNAVDGLIIAASFLISIPIGVAATLSVIAHEIPQEIGDFALLLHSGYSRRKAFTLNLLSSISTIPTAILAYFALDTLSEVIPYVMAISASSFLYIALTDIYPELHSKVGLKDEVRELIMMLLGAGIIIILLQFH